MIFLCIKILQLHKKVCAFTLNAITSNCSKKGNEISAIARGLPHQKKIDLLNNLTASCKNCYI